MNLTEFSQTFDVLLDSYSEDTEYGKVSGPISLKLDEYEKSVLLTQAQELLLRELFEINKELLENSPMLQTDITNLISIASLTQDYKAVKFDDRSSVFISPSDLLLILQEKITIKDEEKTDTHIVVPIRYDEYNRLMLKPSNQPLKKQAWRLFNGTAGNRLEVIPRNSVEITDYTIRYVRKPKPIILVNLGGTYSNGLNIEGITEATPCELSASLHRDIITRAVAMAYQRRAMMPTNSGRRANNNNPNQSE